MGHGRESATAKRAAKRRIAGYRTYPRPLFNIPIEQQRALKSWGSDNFKNIINAQMGGGSAEDKKHAESLERLIGNNAYEHDIWRGLAMSEKEIKKLKVGGDLTTHNQRGVLSSWSKATGVPYEFATANAYSFGGKPVMMVMVGGTKHGVSIGKFVQITDPSRAFEKEVLVSGRSKLKVEAINHTKLAGMVDGYIIEVREK